MSNPAGPACPPHRPETTDHRPSTIDHWTAVTPGIRHGPPVPAQPPARRTHVPSTTVAGWAGKSPTPVALRWRSHRARRAVSPHRPPAQQGNSKRRRFRHLQRPDVGQAHLPGRAIEQTHAKTGFEARETLRRTRYGHAQLSRCNRKAARVRQANEKGDRAKVFQHLLTIRQ